MQDAGRWGAWASDLLLAISCLVFLHNFSSSNFAWCRRGVARSCGLAGTTGPFTFRGKQSRLHLSSSGGGLFDGRPKTQTWVWGAFVFLVDRNRGRGLFDSRRTSALNETRLLPAVVASTLPA
jgi:hypothetical protein